MTSVTISRTCFLVVVLCTTILASSLSEKCNPQDKKALLQIKKELGDPNTYDTWDPNTDCCGIWYGVACDPKNNHRVDYLFFTELNLSKPYPIPSAIGDLPYLDMLQINQVPNLTGPIPQALSKLTKLQFLTISQTNVYGEIPEFLSQLKNLFNIDLSYNKLSGQIPSSLSRLSKLEGISLDGNTLTGSIPPSFGYFSYQMRYLTLSRNQLSGTIPASLGRLNLLGVDFSWNMLQGDASMLFGSNKRTNEITLSSNSLSFDIGKVGLPSNLWTLDINNNRIFGRLPRGLTALQFLTKLNVSHNSLYGEIPQGGTLQGFDVSCYAHNKGLCGSPLPSCKKGT
ncbi:polygalacturonase inhibitor 2-like [Abrus precatorius]|uniref:Polygalacturonase inhibitor 2-like n=1 Tax=Abrus precatorius TaxID=3816 RepID=A0A8B8KWX6_ABRPR|nr:polygalacturonase inhibitor 2-like [Abrus precatorius]